MVSSLNAAPTSLCPFNNFHDSPSLGLADRSGLHNRDLISNATFILLVMDFELLSSLDDLLVKRMTKMRFDTHNYRLIHAGADYFTDSGFPFSSHSFIPLFLTRGKPL
jgi:hypothetical protein